MYISVRKALLLTHKISVSIGNRIEHRLKNTIVENKSFTTSLGESYAQGWINAPCIFVLSTGRVGTMTLTQLLALSPHIIATHEPEPRLIKASFDAFMEGGDTGYSDKWRAVVFAARDESLCFAYRLGKIYVETNNRLTYLARTLATSFPGSRFIHLHRHPYEVVRSSLRRGRYQGHSWDFAVIRPRPGEPWAEEWETLSPLEKNAWHWARTNAEALDVCASLPESRTLELRADELFAGDEQTLKRLFAFVGSPLPAKRQIEKMLGLKLNAGLPKREGAPTEWSETQQKAVWEKVEKVARSLGYEP